MYPLNEFKISDRIPSQCWSEWNGKVLKTPKIFAKVNALHVVDYVQQGNTGTSITCCLFCVSTENTISEALT
jgi:hypothetical protein